MKRNSENAKRRFRLAAIQISGFLHLLIIPVMEWFKLTYKTNVKWISSMNKSWNEQILKSGCIVPKVNKQPIKPISRNLSSQYKTKNFKLLILTNDFCPILNVAWINANKFN